MISSRLGSVRNALREYEVGAFEGLTYGVVAVWRWREYERVDAACRTGDRHSRLAVGEGLAEMEERFSDLMMHLDGHHGANEQVVVVSHGGLYRVLLPFFFDKISGEDARAHPLGHCESIVAIHEDGRWQCRQWGLASGRAVGSTQDDAQSEL